MVHEVIEGLRLNLSKTFELTEDEVGGFLLSLDSNHIISLFLVVDKLCTFPFKRCLNFKVWVDNHGWRPGTNFQGWTMLDIVQPLLDGIN